MPYIKRERRNAIQITQNERPQTVGELNYLITDILTWWMADADGSNYEIINSAIGVLECAKQELYRRMAAPYEDKKAEENGDVYFEL